MVKTMVNRSPYKKTPNLGGSLLAFPCFGEGGSLEPLLGPETCGLRLGSRRLRRRLRLVLEQRRGGEGSHHHRHHQQRGPSLWGFSHDSCATNEKTHPLPSEHHQLREQLQLRAAKRCTDAGFWCKDVYREI